MAVQIVAATQREPVESDRKHVTRLVWENSEWAKRGSPLRHKLESLDHRASTAWSLLLMANAHLRGKYDAESNEGFKYTWLTEGQALAIGDAAEELLTDALGDIEWLREEGPK